MNKVEAFERVSDALINFVPLLVILSVIVPWLAIIPLFFTTPPSEPVGDNCCRHWQECIEERNRMVSLPSPDQEGNEDGTTTE